MVVFTFPTGFTLGTTAPTTNEYEFFFLFLFPYFSVLFEWYRMKKQAPEKINCMLSLNDPRHEAKEKLKIKFTLEQVTKTQRGSRSIAQLFP
jgi:hypothetical protein